MIPKGMGEMADACAQCGTQLAPGGAGPAGLCPRCLLGFLLTLPSEPAAEAPGGALVGKEVGNYRVLGVLGAGGMGIVYRARQKGLEREVALKVLTPGKLASQEDVQRFLREARAAAKLRHPNIVPVHEVAVHEGVHFFTMDLIDGMTLAEALRGPDFTPRRALDLLRKAARAVHHAHENGVVHRDLKPSNIMLDRAGEPFITDFGLARDLAAAGLTQSRTVMGTPAYMAPEQALGRVDEIGPRTDVYGLGAVLYECLTGRPPFDGRNAAEVLARAAREEPLPPRRRNPRIQREIETICLKALEREPWQRYPSASALADDIERYLAGQTIHARRAGPAYRAWKFAMRHRAATAVAAVAVIAVAAWMFGPAWIDVAGEPAGAEIRVDGRPAGRSAPARLALFPARRVRISLRAEGHEEAVATVRPGSWRTERVDLRAVKDYGWLVCDVEPRDATIRLERVEGAGASARSRERAKLPTGVWMIRVERDGYAPEADVVAVTPGDEVRIRKALSPIMGALRVTSSVEGARMRVVPVDVPAGGEPREYVIPLEEGLPLPAGRYRLEFGMRNHFGRATEVVVPQGGTVSANATLVPQEMWKFNAGGILGGRPAVADLDGDGDLELVFGTSDETLYAVTAFGEVLWEFHAPVAYGRAPVIADLDGDLLPDVVVGTRGPFVYALRGRDGTVLWRFEAAEMAPSVAAGDLDGDSVADIVVGSHDDHVYALAGRTGAILWRFQTGGDVYAPAAVGDVNGDSWPDVVIPSRDEVLYALSGRDGSPLWRCEIGPQMFCAPALADLDGDSMLDVVASTSGPSGFAQVALRGLDGGLLWEAPHAGHGITTPVIADVNSDGVPDVLTGAGHFYALSGRDGTQIWKRELLDAQGSAPALADLDGDSVQDVVVGSSDWNLHALSGRDGSVIWRFQTGNWVGSPAIADFDGDSAPDVVVGSADGFLYLVRGTAPPVGWTFRAGGSTILLCPDAADLNADEVRDVLAAAKREKLYALSGRDGSPLWTWGSPGEVTGTPVLADLNNDSVMDVVLRNEILLQRLSGRNGEPLEDWSLPWQDLIADGGWHAPELVDLNGDSVLDWVMDIYDSHVQARNGADGSLLWRTATGHELKAAPAIARLDDDDVPDVLVASDDSNIYAVSGRDGSILWRFATGGDASSRPVLTDLNGDSTPDAVVGSMDGYLYALSGRDGSLLWRSETGFQYDTYAVLADLDGDTMADVVATSYDWRVLAVSGRDGSRLWSFRLPDRTYMPPVLFEVDGDSAPDVVVGTLSGFLYAISGRDGSLIGRIAVVRPVDAMVAADLDGDGAPELLLGLRDGTVSALHSRPGAIFGAASSDPLRRARWNLSHDAFFGAIREAEAGLEGEGADDPATRALLLFVRAKARIHIADLAGALEDIHEAHARGLRSPSSAALRMLLDIRLGRETDSSGAAEALMEGAPSFLAALVDSPDLLASVEPAAYRAALERALAALPEPARQGLPGAALLLLLGRHEAVLEALDADRMLASTDLTTLAHAATLRSLASLLAGDEEQAARLRAVAATSEPGRAFLQMWPKTAEDLERLLRID